jgi:hypothetical protein
VSAPAGLWPAGDSRPRSRRDPGVKPLLPFGPAPPEVTRLPRLTYVEGEDGMPALRHLYASTLVAQGASWSRILKRPDDALPGYLKPVSDSS